MSSPAHQRAREIVCQMVDDAPHQMLSGQQFSALVKHLAAALEEEREACAKVADDNDTKPIGDFGRACRATSRTIAAAIRSRKVT